MPRSKLLLVIFGAVLLGAALHVCLSKPKSKNIFQTVDITPLGNKLSAYFYYINTDQIKDRYLIKRHKQQLAVINDPQLKKFYTQWRWETKRANLGYLSDPQDAHSQFRDGVSKPEYLKFWQTVRPQIYNFYVKTLRTDLTQDPVVHFRCGDIPFIKHAHYHLTKAATVQWMAQQIVARGYKKIIFLNCNNYRSQNPQSCSRYSEFYMQIFKDANLEVVTQCNTVLQDFELMISSPLLVSLNFSSYSFMAGISKDPQNYISCNGGQEFNDHYILQTQADWLLSQEPPLLHKDVVDYSDYAAVLPQLQS